MCIKEPEDAPKVFLHMIPDISSPSSIKTWVSPGEIHLHD